MGDWETVIGLEIHAELNTKTKIYCGCKNEFGAAPNTNVCPVCMGLPGALPVMNGKVTEYAVKMGHALNCEINPVSSQARKNYFYPDLPKAYQISQGEFPICGKGHLDILVDGKVRRIGINRIHTEEDAGKLIHDGVYSGSLVDLNRCGVPLIEIVTEPDLRSSHEAWIFLTMIKSILRYIDISDCKMQEGSIRCDVNVSVRKSGQPLGTRCEMKNINSFSAAVRAIEFEADRQIKLLENGGTVVQETRRWDDMKGNSTVMRTKENAQDYRYFPEPDMGATVLDERDIAEIGGKVPELPNEKQIRYVNEYGMSETDAYTLVLDCDKSSFFDDCCAVGICTPKEAAKWIIGDISRYTNDTGILVSDTKLTPQSLAELVKYVENDTVSVSGAKKVFDVLISDGGVTAEIIRKLGVIQNSDADFIEKLVEDIIQDNEKSVADYKNGKDKALGFLVGQAMKRSQGRANPSLVREVFLRRLAE